MIEMRDSKGVKVLLEYGVNAVTIILGAAQRGDEEIIKFLEKSGEFAKRKVVALSFDF